MEQQKENQETKRKKGHTKSPRSIYSVESLTQYNSMTINTACSSSMYALHLACQAMALGECDGAIVGGTNLILTVDQQMNTARMGVLSPTNQCHTFDEAADGYGRAEGVGALYVRPLSAAIRDGDPIRAVIRATAVGR